MSSSLFTTVKKSFESDSSKRLNAKRTISSLPHLIFFTLFSLLKYGFWVANEVKSQPMILCCFVVVSTVVCSFNAILVVLYWSRLKDFFINTFIVFHITKLSCGLTSRSPCDSHKYIEPLVSNRTSHQTKSCSCSLKHIWHVE